MWNARIAFPATVAAGELVEVRTLIAHPMVSGFQRDARGVAIPRDILTEFRCSYNGEEVFRAELHPAVAANPYLAFHLRASTSGPLEFLWRDQHGKEARETRQLVVDG